jgi:hypothetical protein
MKVGDFVQISVESIMSGKGQETVEGFGVVLRFTTYECALVLWSDGKLEENPVQDLVVINESR